jgi:hypothetical protein
MSGTHAAMKCKCRYIFLFLTHLEHEIWQGTKQRKENKLEDLKVDSPKYRKKTFSTYRQDKE